MLTGRVRVTRQGGGFGESVIGATLRPPALGSGSDSRAWPGKREQVWPSGPMPSKSGLFLHRYLLHFYPQKG